MEQIANGLAWYVVFLFSTTCHEAAHAYSALRLGDATAYEGGQVTLNPIPHVRREPFGTVLVPLLSFLIGGWMVGWASAPYNAAWALQYPRRSAMMALAGPAANLLLVFTAALFIHTGIAFDLLYAPDVITFQTVVASSEPGVMEAVATFLSIAFSLNLILFTFNLLPLPPLDGSGIIPLFLSDLRAVTYMRIVQQPQFMFIGILVAWKLFDFVFYPVHVFSLNLLYPGSNYQ
jgi:Zn-dependent protease